MIAFLVSDIAQSDIDAIYEYSIYRFGIERTIVYMLQMEKMFLSIAAHPNLGTKRTAVAANILAIAYHSHVIYYEINRDEILNIVRIIHGSRDITLQIK